MNIVIVIDVYDYQTNGTVMTAYRFVEEFKRQGHNVRVVATGAYGEGCYEVPERRIPIVTQVAAKQQIRFGEADIKVLREAFTGADIIHFYLPFKLEKAGRKLAQQMGIPSTSAFHLQPENITYNIGLKGDKIIPSILYRLFRKRFYRHFDQIHCPSLFIADQLRKHKYEAKLQVISNGVDKDFCPAPPVQGPKAPKEFFDILMIGRFATEKRQDVLIKGIAKSKYADKIRLTLAGKGPKQKKLEKLAQKYLKNPVTFGFFNKEQLIEVIRGSDLYVHAADIEIEAISCIEAFSCGVVPVIANSSRSATPQFALDERSLFEAGSDTDLAKKIDYWIEHETERAEMSVAYAEHAKNYSLSYSVKKAEEMFREAIQSHRENHRLHTKEGRKMRKYFVKHSKIYRFFSWLFYYLIATPFLWVYMKLGYGLRVRGRKNLRKVRKTGVISVSNHVHILDCAMNAAALWPRKVAFTSLKSNFNIPVAGKILKFAGVMPVASCAKELAPFKAELRWLLKKKSRMVHVYAEGHLINYYAGFREFNRGAFVFACEAQVPVLPVVISWRKRRGLFKLFLPSKPCATVTIGEPLLPNYVLLSRDQQRDLENRVRAEMERIYALSNGGNSVDYYQGKNPEEYHTRAERKQRARAAENDRQTDLVTEATTDGEREDENDAREHGESNSQNAPDPANGMKYNIINS